MTKFDREWEARKLDRELGKVSRPRIRNKAGKLTKRGREMRDEAAGKEIQARRELQAAIHSGDTQRIAEARSEVVSRQLAYESIDEAKD